jgi:hypothetical protein
MSTLSFQHQLVFVYVQYPSLLNFQLEIQMLLQEFSLPLIAKH